jgi:hypothetical protein
MRLPSGEYLGCASNGSPDVIRRVSPPVIGIV